MDFKPRLFEHFTRITKALGSGNRLRMLELLAQGERSVENLDGSADLVVGASGEDPNGSPDHDSGRAYLFVSRRVHSVLPGPNR